MQSKLLTDTEACIHLGITKELLYAYVRNAPKKHLGHSRKLASEFVEGKNMFDKNELDSFDSYLKEPWSETGDNRPAIPKYIKEFLKTEIGGKCPITQKGYPLEDAHIKDYSVSRNHHHHNIIRIAKDEHTKFDNGILSREILLQTKERLVTAIRDRLKAELGISSHSSAIPIAHSLFLGREIELKELIRSMETERLVLVEGIGGVGKTQLLLNAISNVTYHNPMVWINVESINTLEDLHILISNEVSKILGSSVANNLLESLNTVQATFVFDGLENLLISFRDEVEDWIYQLMTRTLNIQLLITSQIDISIFDQQKVVIKMQGIDEEHSIWLLKSIIQNNISPNESELKWILEFCNGHPLSLKLTASIINFYKGFGKSIEHLQKEDSLKQPLRKAYNKSNALTACLNTVYSVLNKDQLKVLHLAKFFPVGVKHEWAKSMLELDNFEYEIAVLQQFFMVDIEVDLLEMERIVVQNPLRKFLHDRSKSESLENHLEYEKDVLSSISMEALIINRHYIETSQYGSAEYGILRMESELPNIMGAFNTAKTKIENDQRTDVDKEQDKYHTIVGSIASSMGKYFFVRGFYEYGVMMAKVGIQISIEQKVYESVSSQYMYLSQLQSRQYDVDGAIQTVKELDEFAKHSQDNYALICSNWMNARLEFNKGKYKTALNFFEKAIKMMKSRIEIAANENMSNETFDPETMKFQEVGNLGLMHLEVGGVYEKEEDYKKALECYKLGLDIQLKLRDEVNVLSCYYHIANCYLDLGKFELAIEHYFICVEGFLSHGNFEYLANTMAELGRNVEFDLSIANNDLLSEEVYEMVLNNLNYRLKNIVLALQKKTERNNVDAELVPFELVGQMFLLVQLTTFSEHYSLLYDWALTINEEIDIELSGINQVKAIVNLAHAIGSFDYWGKLSKEEQKTPLQTIYISCLIINGGPDIKSKTRVFYWLAKWFRHIKLDEEATAEKLWNQAFNYLQ